MKVIYLNEEHVNPIKRILPQLFTVTKKAKISNFVSTNLKNNERVNKPHGTVLWTSSAKSIINQNTKEIQFTSAWDEWCQIEDFRNNHYKVLLFPKKSIKIWVLTEKEDLFNLPTYEKVDFNGDKLRYIDYEKLAKQVDALWLTHRGYKLLSSYIEDKDNMKYKGLYGWDMESVVWFNSSWIDFSYDISHIKNMSDLQRAIETDKNFKKYIEQYWMDLFSIK